MLHLIDAALESFLRATVPLSAPDVDVSFEAPDRAWSAKLTRPTLSVFLWDIRRSSRNEQAGLEEIEVDGRLVRRLPLPRIELRYVVTAWTSVHGDERALLAGAMRSILAHGEIPETYLPDGVRGTGALRLLMNRSNDDQPGFGATLDGQLRPGVGITVVAPVDTDVFTPGGPPVEVLELASVRMDVDGDAGRSFAVRRVAGEVSDPAAIGAEVISPRGSGRVNAASRFVVPAAAGDEIVIATDPPLTVVVPRDGGIRI